MKCYASVCGRFRHRQYGLQQAHEVFVGSTNWHDVIRVQRGSQRSEVILRIASVVRRLYDISAGLSVAYCRQLTMRRVNYIVVAAVKVRLRCTMMYTQQTLAVSDDYLHWQEVDYEHYSTRLSVSMKQLGYEGVLLQRRDDLNLATFWDCSMFQLVTERHSVLHQLVETRLQVWVIVTYHTQQWMLIDEILC